MEDTRVLDVTHHLLTAGFEIEEVARVVDANYVLDMARSYAGRLKPPFSGFIGRLQLAMAELSKMDGIVKTPSLFSSLYYIDQKMRIQVDNKMVETINYADLCSKIHENETAETMMEKWHRIHQAEWICSKMALWTHISNTAKRLIRKKPEDVGQTATLPQFRSKKAPDNSLESFQTTLESTTEDPQDLPVVVVPDDISGPNSRVHRFKGFHSYNLTKPTYPRVLRDNDMSVQFLKFRGRFRPLKCAQRAAGAVVFAKRKFKSLLSQKCIGKYDDNR
ncbi:MAG: hypothetical protein GY830_10595, partial [Bacteroidetes bacterium]|nr:hypothetical protein [Bacteroidota bacterium]